MGYLTLCCSVEAQQPAYRDIYPDTWVGTDALGRTMPDFEEVGTVKTDQRRVVGIFYLAWHTQNHGAKKDGPYEADVTKVLQNAPDARLEAHHPQWKDHSYHWGEPEMDYFLSQDEYVIRKDMSMLADAGVDVLVMDVTNAVCYWDEWDVIFGVMQKMQAEGSKVPKFCFWAFNGPVITVVQDLYDRIYKEDKFRSLWFYWDDKPLLLYNSRPDFDANRGGITHKNPHYDPDAKTNPMNPRYNDPDYCDEYYQDYTKAVKEFFTLRTMWWGYYEWGGERFVGTEDNWSFGYCLSDPRVQALKPEELLSTHKGQREQAAVTPAQHPVVTNHFANMGVGKSWSRDAGQPPLNEYDLPVPTYVPWLGETVENPEGYGIYFQERWDEAIAANPQFLYINDWNEWTAGKYNQPDGETTPWLGRNNPFIFVDQYNSEFNRCVHPMKGGYTDNYYMQMAQNIRKYKGIRALPENEGYYQIVIDGAFDDWNTVANEYRDTKGDVFHRDAIGYGGVRYVNDSGRNDIITSKVAVDEQNIYFWVETANPLSSHKDPHWMMLFLDADKNSDTGWYGYDYLINLEVIDDKVTTLMKYDGKKWTKVADISYRYTENQMELAIPRKLLQLDRGDFIFDFKWSDNVGELIDPISFCLHGDTAPNRRFNYRFDWKL